MRFALLAAISIAWAASYVFIGDADHVLSPITATAAMTLIAAAVLLPAVSLGLKRPLLQPLRQRAWVPLVMGFTAIALPNLAVVQAEETVSPALAALLGTTVPILTLLITTFITRQTHFSPLRLAGVGVALVGLAIFVGFEELFGDDVELIGMLTMMSGGLVFALNGVLASYRAKDLDEYALAAWTITFGAVPLTVAAFTFESPLDHTFDFATVWPLVAQGVIGIAIAYLGYYVLVARAGAYFASLYAFLVPLFGVLGAALVFAQPVTASHILGLDLVLLGLVLMNMRAQQAVPEAAPASS